MKLRQFLRLFVSSSLLLFVAGCHTDMWVQPKMKPMQPTELFSDGSSSRMPVDGTVARGQLRADDAFYQGRGSDGKLLKQIPMAKTMSMLGADTVKEVVLRGQEEFNAFCSPCHGRLGDGKGMIAQRGLDLKRKPANYHSERLRKLPDGHYFDTITHGHGVMFSYAARIVPQDRWAIVAYIRTLQLSQSAKASDVPPPAPVAPAAPAAGGGH